MTFCKERKFGRNKDDSRSGFFPHRAHHTDNNGVYINLKSTSPNCCLKFSSKHCWKNCWSRNFTGNKTLPKAIKESPYFHCRVVLTCNFSYYLSITKFFLLLIHSVSQDYNGFNWLQLIVQRNYNSIPTHEGIPCTLESSWPALLPSE